MVLLLFSFGIIIVSGIQYWTTRGKPPVEKKRITEKVTEEEFPSPEELLRVDGELAISEENVEIEEGIVFIFTHENYAFGAINYGFCIDHQGKIFLYDLSDQHPGRTFEEYIEKIYSVVETEPVGKISQKELQYYYKALMEVDVKAKMIESSGEIVHDAAYQVIYGVRLGTYETLGSLLYFGKVEVLDDDYAKIIYKWLMDMEETIPWNKDKILQEKSLNSEKGR